MSSKSKGAQKAMRAFSNKNRYLAEEKRLGIPHRPDGMPERIYRMINRRRETEIINGQEFVLQTVSLRWYYETNDKYGMTGGGRKDSAGYIDALLRNIVVSPPEVASKGLGYFEERDDLETAETLVKRGEAFLRRGKSGSAEPSAKGEGKQG